jgi:Pyridine nucleotide-disulphide oxidoreductase
VAARGSAGNAEHVQVAVVGGGQAGLAVGRELASLGVEPVVIERGRVAQTWRERWESFCLVTPNWCTQLPGGTYDGAAPDAFMLRDELVAHLEEYAEGSGVPVREGVDVQSIDVSDDGVSLCTSEGDLRADAAVIATGAYQRPHRPPVATALPASLLKIDVEGYQSERALPRGRILMVGSGQSGCQIAEELQEAGRDVVVACGKAPWLPRRIGGRDLMWWAQETGFLDHTVDSLPSPSARLNANLLATGHGGGRDLHLRTLRHAGVTLTGHFVGVSGHEAVFAADLRESMAWGDERYGDFAGLVRKLVRERGLDDPELEDPLPFGGEGPERLDLRDFGAVIFAAGFRPDYSAWLHWPEAFDDLGFPIHEDGASVAGPGIYFVGVHFLRKRKSALLIGVGEDAAIVARRVAAGVGVA